MSTEMERPTEALDVLQRALADAYNGTYTGTIRLTMAEMRKIADWLDYLEANQIQVMPVNEVPQRCEVLDNGEWRLRKPRRELVGR
jgi:hypothetical protein